MSKNDKIQQATQQLIKAINADALSEPSPKDKAGRVIRSVTVQCDGRVMITVLGVNYREHVHYVDDAADIATALDSGKGCHCIECRGGAW